MTLMTQVANPAWLFDLKFFNSPSVRFQEETFWRSLCLDCRKQSVFEHIFRPLKNQTAWDVAGPVQWKWHDELLQVVDEYMSKNRREILKGKAWLGSIDCWMVGEHLATTKPTIVVTSLHSGATKRLVRLLQNDHHIKTSGFELMKRKSCLKRTGGGTHEKSLRKYIASPKISYKRAPISSYLGRRFAVEANDPVHKRCATYGGFVIVNGNAYVLTVAHVFLRTHFYDHPTQAGNLEEPETVSAPLEEESETDDSDSANNSSETDKSDPVVDEDAIVCSKMLDYATCSSEDEPNADASFRLVEFSGLGTCADLKADWALVKPPNLPESLVNRIVAGGQILTISTLGDFTQGMKLLVINNDSEPVQSTCSGTRSLISLPGSNGMQVAYVINHPSISGESGSWVIDGTTGDFCGVIVAASPDGNSSYVVSSRDIFASIANLYNLFTGDDIPQISLPYSVESQQTPSREGTMSDSDQAQITTLSHARPPHHRYDPHAAFSALTGPTRTSQPSTLEFVPGQGYQDNTHIENFRPTGQSSGGLLDSSSSTLPVQQQRSYARNEHDGELSQARNWSNLTFGPTANLMSHSIGFDDHNLQAPGQSGGVDQRPYTVVHLPSLQEERQDDIQSFPAFQAYEDTLEAELYGDDGLSGVGYGVDGGMFSGFTDDVMPPENSTMQYVTPPANSMMQYYPPRSSLTSEHNTGTGLDDDADRLKMTESLRASSRPQRRGQQRTPGTSGISPLPPDVHAGKKRTSSDAGLPSSTQHA